MALNAMERVLNQQSRKTVIFNGRKLIICGKAGVLAYLNLTPDPAVLDSSYLGVDATITRKAHKRARWYGDSVGSNVGQSTTNIIRYPTTEGSTLPGKPVGFEAVSDRGGDPTAGLITGTVELTGPFGHFIAYMEAHRPTKSVRFKTPRGKFLAAPTLNATDFALID